jgi:hypothetical protein
MLRRSSWVEKLEWLCTKVFKAQINAEVKELSPGLWVSPELPHAPRNSKLLFEKPLVD